mgnify:CR=1 FL=1
MLARELEGKGIRDKAVLAAIARIPREAFVDEALSDMAYLDRPLPIEAGQTISQPYTVARQTELLRLDPGDKVLEIGTGSGYLTALLASRAAEVVSVGDQKMAKIIKLNPRDKKISLSFRQAQSDLQRQEYQKYQETQDDRLTFGDLIKDQLRQLQNAKKSGAETEEKPND